MKNLKFRMRYTSQDGYHTSFSTQSPTIGQLIGSVLSLFLSPPLSLSLFGGMMQLASYIPKGNRARAIQPVLVARGGLFPKLAVLGQ